MVEATGTFGRLLPSEQYTPVVLNVLSALTNLYNYERRRAKTRVWSVEECAPVSTVLTSSLECILRFRQEPGVLAVAW